GSGSTLPVRRCRPSQRDTVASPMPNRAASSGYVPWPARWAATTRSRRSFEYGVDMPRSDQTDPITARGSLGKPAFHLLAAVSFRGVSVSTGLCEEELDLLVVINVATQDIAYRRSDSVW